MNQPAPANADIAATQPSLDLLDIMNELHLDPAQIPGHQWKDAIVETLRGIKMLAYQLSAYPAEDGLEQSLTDNSEARHAKEFLDWCERVAPSTMRSWKQSYATSSARVGSEPPLTDSQARSITKGE